MVQILILTTAIFLLISLVVIIINFFTAPLLKNLTDDQQHTGKKISVLIPARNEEHNIGKCLAYVLNQDVNIYEIIVLDDQSSDNTKNIVSDIAAEHSNLKLVDGEPLPKNWIGKTWACEQLGRIAKGDLLLFIDADVEMKPRAVRSALHLLNKYEPVMLSCFPTQKLKYFGEWMIVPLMNWLLLSFLPLKSVYSSKNNSLAAANGQFILVDRKTYINMGSHERVSSQIVEDMELIRNYKSAGLKVMTVLGNNTVYCRMYNSFSDAFNGFSKNFFTGFRISATGFIILILVLFTIYFVPYIFVFMDVRFLWLVLIIILSRIVISVLSNQSVLLNLLLHPLQILIMLLTGIYSVIVNKRKRIVWKERPL